MVYINELRCSSNSFHFLFYLFIYFGQRAGLGFLRTEQYLEVLAKEEQSPVLFPSQCSCLVTRGVSWVVLWVSGKTWDDG